MDHFCYYASCLSCFLVCSLQPRGPLLGNGQPLGLLVCEAFCVLSIAHVVPLVWRILIYDLCLLTFFHLATQCVQTISDDYACEGFRQYIDKGKEQKVYWFGECCSQSNIVPHNSCYEF